MKTDDARVEDDVTRSTSIGEFPVVVLKVSMSKTVGAYACRSKGDDEYATRRGAQDMNHLLGYNRMSFKADQEPALRVLMKNVKKLSGDQCILLESPVMET